MSWLASAASVLLISQTLPTSHAQGTYPGDMNNLIMDTSKYAGADPGRPHRNTKPLCQWAKADGDKADGDNQIQKTGANRDAALKGLEFLKSYDQTIYADVTEGRGSRIYSAKDKGVPARNILSATIWIFGNNYTDEVSREAAVAGVQRILDDCPSAPPAQMLPYFVDGVDVVAGSVFVKPNLLTEQQWPYVVVTRNADVGFSFFICHAMFE